MKHDHAKFFLDANCINARQSHHALNDLEKLRKLRLVTLIYSEITHAEASAGNGIRSDKAADYSYTKFEPYCDGNPDTKNLIERILFPAGATSENQKNDVAAVYHAERLRWPLVTMDGASKSQPGGILGNAIALHNCLGIVVLTPEQALQRAVAMLQHLA